MDDQGRQSKLEDAVRDIMTTQDQRRTAAAPETVRRREIPLAAVILLGWAVIGWIWLAEPAAIFGPDPSATEPAAEREARLRYAMYLQHHEIGVFTRDSGRPPRTLADLDLDAVDGVELEFDQGGEWALVGRDSAVTLRLAEAMSADSFLGNRLAVLREPR